MRSGKATAPCGLHQGYTLCRNRGTASKLVELWQRLAPRPVDRSLGRGKSHAAAIAKTAANVEGPTALNVSTIPGSNIGGQAMTK